MDPNTRYGTLEYWIGRAIDRCRACYDVKQAGESSWSTNMRAIHPLDNAIRLADTKKARLIDNLRSQCFGCYGDQKHVAEGLEV